MAVAVAGSKVVLVESDRLKGKEPLVLAGGLGVLGASAVMPIFWNQGITPIPPCIFHTITGQPCPFCGATRSFVWTAHGQLGAAFQVFPIGPIMFLALVAAVVYCGWAIATGKRLKLVVPWRLEQAFYISLLIILGLNWLSKLLFLGFGPSPFPS
ncbi:MAG: DUF2752 domain-containing protein [Candidatus Dormiibacterota bacterium]